ncbi:MAG TPA: response regulator [Chitinophagaceae bacterium]|nr:response regulator [Chitinophagaceae bacterium]HEX5652490.1 response regulator [Chitinophagaceae bacterium]
MPNRKNILVLDDDPDIGNVIKMILEYQGYAVTVIDRHDKIGPLQEWGRYDLVIIDMLLSGINGVDICMQLKKEAATSTLPVLMMSAHPHIREEYLRAGAHDYMRKPFELEELLSKVNHLLNQVHP